MLLAPIQTMEKTAVPKIAHRRRMP